MQLYKEGNKIFFTRELMRWHDTDNTRSLPWKQETDPYKIWLSEIILQQTRAEQGLPYYQRFIEAYPTIRHLADAADEDVFRLWQGLGYYNRCKNLLHTARTITNAFNGFFPQSYEQIIQLKGVGNYTAAAIASFAFNLPHAVVDGNVNRVLARFFGIDVPFDTTAGKKIFQSLADELLDQQNSAGYNQAIMDLGATVCTPVNAQCNACPLQEKCVAYKKGLVDLLPVRSKKLVVKKRFFHYLILINTEQEILIRKRTGKDIWQNLYEPLLIESHSSMGTAGIRKHPDYLSLGIQDEIVYEGSLTQRLTHQLIETSFFRINTGARTVVYLPESQWVHLRDLKKFAFPKTLVSFFEKKFYF